MFLQALLVLAAAAALYVLARGPGRGRRAWMWGAVGGALLAAIGFVLRSPWVTAAGAAMAGVSLLALTSSRRRRKVLVKRPSEFDMARRLLGVGRDATADEIRAAWRLRMAEAHPDRGGDPELAKKLVDARDLLLRQHRLEPPQEGGQ